VTVQWTTHALSDLSRLHEFLAIRNRDAAARTVQALVAAPARLAQTPRIGERLAQFEPREVRRVLVGDYEVRYEIRESRIYVLRLWHTREDRP
jgi:plasmid stabilization system protein ParE